jgi:hypothetical protein
MRMNFEPECAVAASEIIACVVLFDSFHFVSVPASKSSLKMVVGDGAGLTVTLAVPLVPPHEAVMVTVPATSALTSPEDETVATLELLVDQVIVRPLRALPLASRGTAESWTVAPSCTLGAVGDTLTLATGTGAAALTVTDDIPLLLSLRAVIVALPAATPLTNPALDTVAAAVLLDDHATLRPVKTLPLASLVTAES